jgi:hypothetical protein
MTRRRPLNLVMTAICGVLLAGAAACSSGGTSASSTTSAAPVESQQTEDSLPPPAPESTGAEQPQSQQNQPSVTLAALPVGGKTDFTDSTMCVNVNLSKPLPDGVQVQITIIKVSDGFRVVGDGSGCDHPCPGQIFGPDSGNCNAKVALISPPGSDGLTGSLSLGGICVAPDVVACQRVKGAVEKQGTDNLVELTAVQQASPPSSSSSSDENSSSSEESQSSAESSSGSSG